MMNLGSVLFENVFATDAPGYSIEGVDTAGSELAHALDWRDYTKAKIATARAIVVGAAAREIDTIVVWLASTGPEPVGPITITMRDGGLSSSPVIHSATYAPSADLTDIGMAVVSGITWTEFSKVTTTGQLRIDIVPTTASPCYIRQITVGKRLTFAIGQWSGVTPPGIQSGVTFDTAIAVNGSILGRNRKRSTRSSSIDLSLLTQEWVRASWVPFQAAASKHAFWWRWNPERFPLEVAFAAATEIQPPQNDSPPGRMKVGMTLQCLVN